VAIERAAQNHMFDNIEIRRASGGETGNRRFKRLAFDGFAETVVEETDGIEHLFVRHVRHPVGLVGRMHLPPFAVDE